MKSILLFYLFFASTSLSAVELHYFGQVIAAKTTIDDDSLTYDGISNDFTLSNLSYGGINIGHQFGSNSSVIMQALLFEQRVNLDLLQFKHSHASLGTTRVGRQRLPFFWFSENIQVNALLPWINGPREVYGKIPIHSITGASIEKKYEHIGFNFYAGQVKESFDGETTDYDVNSSNSVGLRVDADFSFIKFFANYNRGESTLALKTTIPAPVAQTTYGYNLNYDLGQVQIFTGGLCLDFDKLKLYSEFLYTTSESDAFRRISSYYISPVYAVNETWQTVATFSRDHESKTHLFPSKTTSIGLNLNYFFDLSNVFKIGVEQVNFKRISVASPSLAGTSTSSVSAIRPPGKNFHIYAASWSFVY